MTNDLNKHQTLERKMFTAGEVTSNCWHTFVIYVINVIHGHVGEEMVPSVKVLVPSKELGSFSSTHMVPYNSL